MIREPQNYRKFCFNDFTRAFRLKWTEYDVEMITWPQSAKIRENFVYRIFYLLLVFKDFNTMPR